MIGVTADTNVYVSALAFAGAPRQFLKLADAGRFALAISPVILAKIRGVLGEKLTWDHRQIDEALVLLAECTTLAKPDVRLDVVAADPGDDRIIECAVAAGSRFVVSDDADLLRLGSYGQIRMIGVADFLKIVEEPV